MFRKGMVCAALLVTVTGAYADSKWEVINQTPTATFYIDTTSIARTGDTVNVWTKAVNSTPRIQDGDKVATAYGLDHFIFNCAEKTGALRSFARFDEKGTAIQSLSRKQYELQAVAPDTPMAKLLERVCQ
ncbi:surface-adhesin E family protein [Paraburkholderia metrosideri]|jgi:hypothetical protein|uniref:Surface-adhesin protein E-like domain-containing protein n=1 Tax=Paraburkholderia metrosideri TaxID=580937 RepID=A0ABN7IEX2_9BURK|nr:surface-adhesin E family protein [Paraburkholderia metrosideri]CAD6559356.1 hypothetical protein LMG28140_06608 [Paraburkholderia metrosideri]